MVVTRTPEYIAYREAQREKERNKIEKREAAYRAEKEQKLLRFSKEIGGDQEKIAEYAEKLGLLTRTEQEISTKSGDVVSEKVFSVKDGKKDKLISQVTYSKSYQRPDYVSENHGIPIRRLGYSMQLKPTYERFIQIAQNEFLDLEKEQSISLQESYNRRINKNPFENLNKRNQIFGRIDKETTETRASTFARQKGTSLRQSAKEKRSFELPIIGLGGVTFRQAGDFAKGAYSSAGAGLLSLTEINLKGFTQNVKTFATDKIRRQAAIRNTKERIGTFLIDFGAYGASKLGVKEPEYIKERREFILADLPRFEESYIVKDPIGAGIEFGTTTLITTGAFKLGGKVLRPLGRSIKGGFLQTTGTPKGSVNINLLGKTTGSTTSLNLKNVPVQRKVVLSYKELVSGFRGTVLRQKATTRIIISNKGIVREQLFRGNKFISVQRFGSPKIGLYKGTGSNIRFLKTVSGTGKKETFTLEKLFSNNDLFTSPKGGILQISNNYEKFLTRLNFGKRKFLGVLEQKTTSISRSKISLNPKVDKIRTVSIGDNIKNYRIDNFIDEASLNVGRNLNADDLYISQSKNPVLSNSLGKKVTVSNVRITRQPVVKTEFSIFTRANSKLAPANRRLTFSIKEISVPKLNKAGSLGASYSDYRSVYAPQVSFLRPQTATTLERLSIRGAMTETTVITLPKYTSQGKYLIPLSVRTSVNTGLTRTINKNEALFLSRSRPRTAQLSREAILTRSMQKADVRYSNALKTRSRSLVDTQTRVDVLSRNITLPKTKALTQTRTLTRVGIKPNFGVNVFDFGFTKTPIIPIFPINIGTTPKRVTTQRQNIKLPVARREPIKTTGVFENIFKFDNLNLSLERRNKKPSKKKKRGLFDVF